MKFFIKNSSLEKEKSDCIIIFVFKFCEFTHLKNHLNAFSSSYINNFIRRGDMQGKIGQTLLLHDVPNITSKRMLLVGCGDKNTLNRYYLGKIVKKTMKILNQFSIKNIIFSLNEINIENCDIYWSIRTIVNSINKYLYKSVKINTSFKKDIYLNSISLNVMKDKYFNIAKNALEHALAINSGIRAAKNLANLPPNVCNPLYLSLQAQKLSEKYKDKIDVTSIDVKEMHKLGMNAYIAVGSGSKNKPYMSVIKYSGKNKNKKNKVIVLIGKGLTFDSGGISIKPSKNMNEMKYDMCGAAAVYGTLIVAAKLNLPLTIIGILAGCENMPGGNAFRPGDILTTMSGKTVEVLNTDAEGRLVLCDVLTYVNRFSPNIVIDIATLTGACVIALGNHFSGFFSNDEKLACSLEKSSQQTNDKIWRLPLSREYEKELYSNFADFSNIGKGKAGAITAACFLYQFSKQYTWAHLDIAGTAWKSGKNQGATGRPVELLSQFLLNESDFFNFE
ncbi:leucyl aminopeptidase [Buchnera aphidicola]|uniref:Probable cytosol aminopeptidase n=1 Tax=Buchnera aphidicola subsp. Rhopalosiphum maidis TaxID=118109 RepID=A0A3G2I5J8_BUCRM|nr:leucyl aminopeptidase [Buchnera aphidicola]AYN24702.1 leucyl aminopeptidase [Buchnera aphidicola (Rhopalosiphum maidis)]